MIENNIPKVFISYSWESKEHSDWVKSLADKLLADGIEAIIDSYDVSPGDRLPKFMESSIRDSDYVIIICTEEYKRKANNREKGVGYESHIISAELYNNHNDRKFIPVIRQGDFNSALLTYLDGKLAIDLRGNPFNEDSYKELIASIFKVKKKPKVGIRPYYVDEYEPITIEGDDIKIVGIITNEVTLPKNDGTRGSALYRIHFRLSSKYWVEKLEGIYLDESMEYSVEDGTKVFNFTPDDIPEYIPISGTAFVEDYYYEGEDWIRWESPEGVEYVKIRYWSLMKFFRNSSIWIDKYFPSMLAYQAELLGREK